MPNTIRNNIQYYLFKFREAYKKKTKGTKRGKEDFVLNKNIEWFGTNYGGFYLNKKLIDKDSVLFSFGIGTDISFDRNIANLGVRRIYLFDPTPKAIDFIKNQDLPNYYTFSKFGLSAKDEKTTFFLPSDPLHISGSKIYHEQLGTGETIEVEMKKLNSICNLLNIENPDILKIDIEGSEFDVLQDIFDSGIFPTQFCIEFHSRFFENGKQMLEEALEIFAQNGYIIGGKSSEEEYLFIKSSALENQN